LPSDEKVVKCSVGVFVHIFHPITNDPQTMNHSHDRYSFFDGENWLSKIHEFDDLLCRVEHVFGMQKKRMGDETLRTVGHF
jgi:hypothetical protein